VHPLTTAPELADALAGPHPPVVVDVRWALLTGADRAAYDNGHIPGAVFADLDVDLADPPGNGRGRHPLPSAERFEETLRTWGLRADRTVVVYDASDAMSAARLWWLLRWAGHDAVCVLDGGLAAWVAADLPLSTVAPEVEPGDVVVTPRPELVLDAAGAAALARTGVLLDARAEVRYRGDQEPVDPVAGHIPGAVSMPTADNVDEHGRFRPDLAARFAHLETVPVGAYCGSGVTAAHTVLALELAGIRAQLYAGSWSQWISDPDRPVANGALAG
jgi:thiosulfate/3-mercaptopyruvate sulfurtransferase